MTFAESTLDSPISEISAACDLKSMHALIIGIFSDAPFLQPAKREKAISKKVIFFMRSFFFFCKIHKQICHSTLSDEDVPVEIVAMCNNAVRIFSVVGVFRRVLSESS